MLSYVLFVGVESFIVCFLGGKNVFATFFLILQHYTLRYLFCWFFFAFFEMTKWQT